MTFFIQVHFDATVFGKSNFLSPCPHFLLLFFFRGLCSTQNQTEAQIKRFTAELAFPYHFIVLLIYGINCIHVPYRETFNLIDKNY